MKILSFISLGTSLFGMISGLYCQFKLVPLAENCIDPEICYLYSDRVIESGTEALLIGGLGLLLSIYPSIKKSKIGYVALLFGLIAVFLGLTQATHLFS